MGQVSGLSVQGITVTDVDRTVARNAGGGLPASVSHVILLGEDAGANLAPAISGLVLLGEDAGKQLGASGAIVIGQQALDAGFVSAGDQDLMVLGNRAMSALTTQASTTYGFIAIGSDIAPVQTAHNMDACVMIGSEILMTDPTTGNGSGCVLIGHGIMRNVSALGNPGYANTVMIGKEVWRDTYGGNPLGNGVFIGTNLFNRANSATGGSDMVAIGANINTAAVGTLADLTSGIFIGANIVVANNAFSSDRTFNTMIGASKNVDGTKSVHIGASGSCSRGTENIAIGYENLLTGAFNNLILIGNEHTGAGNIFDAGNIVALAPKIDKWVLYGSGDTGNIVLGNSTTGDKDIGAGGTNRVKLCNGTVGGIPSSGGYFYVNAGELHWMGSGGTDTIIAPA